MRNTGWIISPKWDLVFFIGSVSLTYAYYGIYKLFLLLPEANFFHRYAGVIVILIFYSLFDHPHIFQTFSRTHGDSAEFSRRRFLYTFGLLTVIASGYGVIYYDLENEFANFLNLYGIWHILRQNTGFLRLYNRRSGTVGSFDSRLDFMFLYSSVALFLLMRIDPAHSAPSWLAKFSPSEDGFYKIFNGFLVVYALRQLYLLRKKTLSLPKFLFMFAIVTTYYFTYVFSEPPFGLLVAMETIYHDVQYQGWIIHFQKKRFRPNAWKYWLAGAMLYGLTFGGLMVLTFSLNSGAYLMAPFIMLVLFHYFIDGKIWRFSKSPELKGVL